MRESGETIFPDIQVFLRYLQSKKKKKKKKKEGNKINGNNKNITRY